MGANPATAPAFMSTATRCIMSCAACRRSIGVSVAHESQRSVRTSPAASAASIVGGANSRSLASADGGVTDYSFDECWRDYRHAIMFTLAYPIVGLGAPGFDLSNDRGMDLVLAMFERSTSAIADLKTWELLPD